MKSLVLALCSTLPLPVATSVAAGQQPVDTARLTPVVITASRTTGAQNVATSATTVLHGDALRARGIETVAAALREVPGATVVQSSSPGSLTSLFLRGGEADYVQVMIDGVTINEPGGGFNFANLSLDNVERIEIVRGPASVLYGSSAMAGVIQIFTRGDSGVSDAELRVRAGQRGLLDAEASAGGGRERLGFWVGAGHHGSHGIHDLNNDARSSTASGRFRLNPAPAAVVLLTTRYADARYDYPTESYGAPLDSNSYSTERRLSTGIDVRYAVRPLIDFRIGGGLSRFQNITNDPIDQRVGEIPDDGGSPTPFETRSLRRNADAQLDLRFIPGSTLTLGGDYDWQRLDGSSDDPGTGAPLERWSLGGYAQITGNAGSRVSYSVGGRREKNELFGTLGNIQVGAGLSVASRTTVRASAGTAFKEPQFFEITGAGFALPNRSLRPERSRAFEFGVEQRFGGDALAMSATWFDQRFQEMIVFAAIPETEGYTTQYINARSAQSRGWELEARARMVANTTLRASYTDLDARYHASATAGATPLTRRPERTASLVLTAPIPARLVGAPVASRLLLTADVSYVGARPDTRFFPGPPWAQAETLPGYTLLGAGAVYTLPPLRRGVRLEAMARVDNLLDEEYEAVAGFATPRRTASVGVRVRTGR